MIVVMSKECTPEQLAAVEARIARREGLSPQVFQGVERIVIGVLGSIPPDLKDEMALLPGFPKLYQSPSLTKWLAGSSTPITR